MTDDIKALHQRLAGGGRTILASRSPRRKEIMEKELGFKDVSIFPSGFPENLDKFKLTPWEYVVETATHKALDVYRAEVDSDIPPGLVIAADTIVVIDNTILEKPRGVDHHIAMLKMLRDSPRPHKVFTAIAVIVPLEVPIAPGYVLETSMEESVVYFKKDVTDEQILDYVKSGEANDAAGGYKIQEKGGPLLVDRTEGDYHNIVGLPVGATVRLINKALDRSRSPTDDEDDEDEEDGF